MENILDGATNGGIGTEDGKKPSGKIEYARLRIGMYRNADGLIRAPEREMSVSDAVNHKVAPREKFVDEVVDGRKVKIAAKGSNRNNQKPQGVGPVAFVKLRKTFLNVCQWRHVYFLAIFFIMMPSPVVILMA